MRTEKRHNDEIDVIIGRARERSKCDKHSIKDWIILERQFRIYSTEYHRKNNRYRKLKSRGRIKDIQTKCDNLYKEFDDRFFK